MMLMYILMIMISLMMYEDNADDKNDNGDSVRKFCLLSAKTYEGGRLRPGQTIKGVKIILGEGLGKKVLLVVL